MDRDAVIKHLGEAWEDTQKVIRKALETDIPLLRKVNDSVLAHGGKQLRPMLTLLVARACSSGRPDRSSVAYAAASELLHNATLIHDDVADESAQRRGFPTVLSMMGPSAAVLLGDFWLARAVGTLTATGYRKEVEDLFAKTLSDLAEGEMLQLEKAELADTTEEDYYRIIYCKTASLFEAACVSGALSVSADPGEIEAARSYARALGLAFQIKDDILDYTGKPEIGKPLGADLREQKITLPLLGILKDNPDAPRIRALVASIPSNPSAVDGIRDLVLSSGGIDYASRCLDGYVEAAVRALGALPPSMDRDMLEELARYNSSRTV